MYKIRTVTSSEMKGINRTAILEFIRRSGVTSRMAIAKALHVSMPTVMRIVDELIEKGLVRDIGEKEKTGGRKRSLIELNAHEHLTIGLDLGGSNLYGAVTDLGGNILVERAVNRNNCQGENGYALVKNLIGQLIQEAAPLGKTIMGIGVGVPGVTFHEQGLVEWSPSLEWRFFPLKERLQSEFNLPVIVDNDANLSALGEMWFGAGINASNLVVINVNTGIGAGVVVDGALYRGAREMAGEIGYLIPGREHLNKKYPDFGALELLAAGAGISRRAASAVSAHEASVDMEAVFAAYLQNEHWAIQIIEEALDYLAIAIAAVITFFDPETIVIGGNLLQYTDVLIGPLNRRLEGRIPHTPPIVASVLGNRAGVLGAMINLLHNTSDFYVVRKLS